MSIVTVNFNDHIGLEFTINSVISQLSNDYEYIIIDGDSDDGSQEVIKRYKEKISYFVSEPDLGIYDAMNKGLTIAKGNYVFFLNSGDVFSNSNVCNVLESNKPECDLVYGDVNLVFNTEKKIRKVHPGNNLLAYLSYEMICHQAIFVKTEILKEIGKFSLAYKYCSDYEMLLKILMNSNYNFMKIDLIIADYDMNGASNQHMVGKIIDEEKKIIWNKYIPSEVQILINEYLKYNFYRNGRLTVLLNLFSQLINVIKSFIANR